MTSDVPASATIPAAPSRRPRILIVDDTPANLAVLVGLLARDYDLTVANSGARALALCAGEQVIDLVLLDVMMPEIDGYEVCRRLRAQPRTRDLPILFLSARSELESVVQGLAWGGNDYLTKPFRPEELLARVRTHLLVRAQQRELAERSVEFKQLLHIMFHDLGNHFALLDFVASTVEESPREPLDDELRRMLLTGVRNGMGLLAVVRELSTAEAKPIALSAVPLAAAVGEALTVVRARAAAKGLALRVDIAHDLRVTAEPNLLINSVITNLLTNAIKYSDPGGAVDVTATRDGGQVRLVVRDEGIGMSAEVLDSLFDLQRSASRRGTAGERGSGFGMPLMRRWVQRFGGRVEVASREAERDSPEHGTTFIVSLPSAST